MKYTALELEPFAFKASENEFEMQEFEYLRGQEKYVYPGGWFVNIGNFQWEEWQQNNLSYRFMENARENGFIYLYDYSRNLWVAIPLDGGRSYYAYGGSSSWTDLYDVTKDQGSSEFRARAIKLLEPLPPYPQEITSNGPKRQIFTQMTGLTHEVLVANWAAGGQQTSCNGFTGWFARAMGSKTYLGRFDLETIAKRTWIPASSGLTPKYGDILRFQSFHVEALSKPNNNVILHIVM